MNKNMNRLTMPDTEKDDVPKPGSDEAVREGCTCPILDNEHGRGYMGMEDIFVYNTDCPLHGGRFEEPKTED